MNKINAAIVSAEEYKNPLDGLVERSKHNAGAPFEAPCLAALAQLRTDDPAAFEKTRGQLKAAGVRVSKLEKAVDAEVGEDRAGSAADELLAIVADLPLYRTNKREPFAKVEVGGVQQTHLIQSKGFGDWLVGQYCDRTGRYPTEPALQAALDATARRGRQEGVDAELCIRLGEYEGKIYLDGGDDSWRAIEIDPTGWRIIDRPPVHFRRTSGMLALPTPVAGGSVNELRPFINVKREPDFILIVAYLLAALRPRGPYPGLSLNGEEGTGKSGSCLAIKKLVDPNAASLRPLPRNEHEFFITANNSYLQCYDNLSSISDWAADVLCRLATGGGYATRQLYSDSDEMIFDVSRPILLNGIEDTINRPDLASRMIFVTLDPIPDEQRKPEDELKPAFEAAAPRILGALLTQASVGLRHLPTTKLAGSPRMADFAKWVTACEHGLWEPGTFLAAYESNRRLAVADVIESDPIASTIRDMMATRSDWDGKSTELLNILNGEVSDGVKRGKSWPTTASALSRKLHRVTSPLRKIGIGLEFRRTGSDGGRRIYICASRTAGKMPSVPSVPSGSNDFNGLGLTAIGEMPSVEGGVAVSDADPWPASVELDETDGDATAQDETGGYSAPWHAGDKWEDRA